MHRRSLLQSFSALAMAAAAGTIYGQARGGFPLWEISSKRASVFLLGHTPPRPDDWMDERIQGLLHRCGHLWDETHHGERSNAQELMQRYGIAPDHPLESRLHGDEGDRLSRAAKAAGVPEASLTRFRPWLAGQELEGAFFSAPGFNGRNADQVLITEAQQLSIAISSEFATLEEAVVWFSALTPTAELQYLLYIIDEILTGHEQGQHLYAQWAAGSDQLAAAWVARMARLYPELYQPIVVDRNRRWVTRIQTMLDAEQPAMIVVGLYHLVGPDRIQIQLEEAASEPAESNPTTIREVKMRIELDSLEMRVIGCLIEKQITTPDQYPLSLNALVNACNQKSNRDPVLDLDEPTVQHTIDALSRKHLVLERSGFGSRVVKYQQLFCNTEFGSLKFSPQELAVVCELLLRGPQTPGELRSRASRMAPFTEVAEVETVLQNLLIREPAPLVARLPRESGRRESRYMQLFGGEPPPRAAPEEEAAHEGSAQTAEHGSLASRVAKLEDEVQLLRAQLAELKSQAR